MGLQVEQHTKPPYRMRPSHKLSIKLSTALILAGFDARPQALTLQLDAPTHNGYHISCTGGKDGAIDLTITGGTPPYQVEWSTGASTEDVADLVAGYYRVGVTDGASGFAEAELTLNEPEKITVELAPYEWPNGYNVSCFNCFNGSIAVTTTGGVEPYAYLWKDGHTTEDRANLGSDNYAFELTDANGCEFYSEMVYLRQPERDDWTKYGNAGTNPGTHYIGTSDNKDVVFKSNGVERLRLLSTGELKISGYGQGLLRAGGGGLIEIQPDGHQIEDVDPFWRTDGNLLNTLNPNDAFLGSIDHTALRIRTNNAQRMVVNPDGRVTIGVDNQPGGALTVRSGATAWGDWITLRRPLDQDDGFWHIHDPQEHDRLLFYYTDENGNDLAGGLSLWNDGKVSIGTTDRPGDYLLYVGTGILTEKVKIALEGTAQWSDYVFKPGYKLMPLDEVQRFIAENGHLPGVPSAECMVEEGLDVVKTNAMLMEKVEELTLHLVEMHRRIKVLEK